jgi:L-amino acid N-acyltransferase YncA
VSLAGNQTLEVWHPDFQYDLRRLVGFFSGLPLESRKYLRYDVTSVEACLERLMQVDGKDHWRLVAELDGRMVGDATLDRKADTWANHVAELRGVIIPGVRRLHIGTILFGELAVIASAAGIERMICEVMEGDLEHIEMMKAIGFVCEAKLEKCARDLDGKLQDLIIMTNDLEDAWRCLQEQLVELDIRNTRNA